MERKRGVATRNALFAAGQEKLEWPHDDVSAQVTQNNDDHTAVTSLEPLPDTLVTTFSPPHDELHYGVREIV